MKKKVIFFSGNRAEYNFQKSIISELNDDFDVYFLISGTHIKKEFGNFLKEIRKDKIKVSKSLNIKGNTKNFKNLNRYICDLNKQLSNYILNKKFDYAFVFSDRFETYVFANICFLNQIPIIHYEGGDITHGGTFDDRIRHAITQLADLHLVTNHKSFKNLNSQGVKKKRISNVGLLGLKKIPNTKDINSRLEKLALRFKLSKTQKFILFTYHSIPKLEKENLFKIKKVVNALKKISSLDWKIIITSPNFDPYYQLIIKEVKKILQKDKIFFVNNLGKDYHLLLMYAGKYKNGICIGNSSSGIKEANFFLCPAINLGNRQLNRLKPKSVFDVQEDEESIIKLINKVYKLNKLKKINFERNLYYKKFSIKKIIELIDINAKISN